MNVIMAIAPNGGIAIANLKNEAALDVPRSAFDPFGRTWHWTGRQPYQPAEEIANMSFREQAPDWEPTDQKIVMQATKPQQVFELPDHPYFSIAERIEVLQEQDPYAMAIAAARVIMRNMHNDAMTATFPDNSKAYIDPITRSVVASE